MTANLWDRPLDRLPAYLFVHQVWIYLCARVPFWFIQVGPDEHLHSPLLPTTDLPPSYADDFPIFTLAVGCFDLFVFVLGDYGCIGIFFFLFVGGSLGLLISLGLGSHRVTAITITITIIIIIIIIIILIS